MEGVAAFFMVTWLVSMILLLLLSDASRPAVVLIGLCVAVFGSLVEADSWRGLDNVFVPIGIYLFIRTALASPLSWLLATSALFLAVVITVTLAGTSLRMTRHAARAFGILLFLMCAYAGLLTSLPAALAIVAHSFAKRVRPCRSHFPDLDLAAAIAGAGCLWIFVGESVGPASGDFFAMSFAGVMAGYVTMAEDRRWWGAIAAVTLAYAAFRAAVFRAAPWHGDLTLLALATIAVGALVVRLSPSSLDRWRAPKLVAFSSVIPLSAYLAQACIQ